jgi:hypothetical protein
LLLAKNLLFDSHQEAKTLEIKLGLEAQSIHACVNDYVFYHGNIVVDQLSNLWRIKISTRSYWIFHPPKGIINLIFMLLFFDFRTLIVGVLILIFSVLCMKP